MGGVLGWHGRDHRRKPRRGAADPVGIVVALWPPVCLAITLELIALVASPTKHHPVTDTVPAESERRLSSQFRSSDG